VVRLLPLADCPACGYCFRPLRRKQRYCCRRCYPRPGRPRVLADRACLVCGATFRPREANLRHCSRACGGAAGRATAVATGRTGAAPPPPSAEWLGRLRGLWAAGGRAKDVAAALGCSLPTVKRWVRRLGLSRPSGNHSAARRGAES
jgi:hypothetical protein